MNEKTSPPRPTPEVARRIEELLREQLYEKGENPAALEPHTIVSNMMCHLEPDGGMIYLWKEEPILHVRPEISREDGENVTLWRMFTQDDVKK